MSAGEVVRPRRSRVVTVLALLISGLVAGSPIAASARPAHPHATVDKPMAIIVPIVSASMSGALLDREELAAKTATGGGWTFLADAAIDVGGTIALDSRIVASIDALANDAPQSARSWLARVTASHYFLLPWGDADPFLLATTGTANRVSTIQFGQLAGVPARELVGWPTGRAGHTNSAAHVHTLGFGTLVASDRVFPHATGTYSQYWSNVVGSALAPNSRVTIESVVSMLRATTHRPAAIALPRNPSSFDPTRAATLLRVLVQGRIHSTPYIPPASDSLGDASIAHTPVSAIRELLAQHRHDRLVSLAGTEPTAIAIPRLASICELAGVVDSSRFPTLVHSYVRRANDFGDVASVRTGSTITVLANTADIPITVTNTSTTGLTLMARVHAVSGIVRVDRAVHKVTIDAGSSTQFTVPVTTIANGNSALSVELETLDGTSVGPPTYIALHLQAQWEGLTLIAFIGIVGTIMGIGVTRQIRDRRRRS